MPDLCQLPLWSSEQKNGQNFSYSESWKYSLFSLWLITAIKNQFLKKNQITETEKNFFLPKLDWLNFKNGFQVFLLSVKMAPAPAQDFIFYFFSLNRRNERIQWNGIKGRSGERKNLEYNKKSRKRVDPSNAGFTSRTGKLVFDSCEPPFLRICCPEANSLKPLWIHLASRIAGHQSSRHWLVKFFKSISAFAWWISFFVSMHFISTKPRQNSWEYVG